MIDATETQQDILDLQLSSNPEYEKELNEEFGRRGLRLKTARKLFK